jgi:O-antigen ligase
MFRQARAQLEKGKGATPPRIAPARASAGPAILSRPAALATLLPGPSPSTVWTEPPKIDATWLADRNNPLRRVALVFGLAFIFVRFSLLNEVLTETLGVNTYILLILAVLSLTGVLLSGGVRRTLASWPTRLWILFGAWLVIAIPFSTWPGDSLNLVSLYLKNELAVMFVTAGLAVTWKEYRRILFVLAVAGLVNELSGRIFSVENSERMDLSFGLIGNANDFACHLLTILPMFLFVFLEAGRSVLRRVVMGGAIAVGLYYVGRTGSRGALVAVATGVVFIFWRSSMRGRIAAAVAVPVLAVVALAVLPADTLQRYATLFSGHSDDEIFTNEAVGSEATRTYLLKTSINLTLTHPLFGVGPGQFANVEGQAARDHGRRGAWQVAHNSYTQASSEAGFPGLLLVVAAVIATFRTLNQIYREARDKPAFRGIASAAFCLMLSLLMFGTASFFLSMVYRFYFPALTGLAVGFAAAARAEFAGFEGTQVALARR